MHQVELEFRADGRGRTQNERLRDYLVAHPNCWLPMPELARVITATGIGAAVHSRIADCRRKFGMTLLHKGGRNRTTGGRISEYYYEDHASSDQGEHNPNPG